MDSLQKAEVLAEMGRLPESKVRVLRKTAPWTLKKLEKIADDAVSLVLAGHQEAAGRMVMERTKPKHLEAMKVLMDVGVAVIDLADEEER